MEQLSIAWATSKTHEGVSTGVSSGASLDHNDPRKGSHLQDRTFRGRKQLLSGEEMTQKAGPCFSQASLWEAEPLPQHWTERSWFPAPSPTLQHSHSAFSQNSTEAPPIGSNPPNPR